MNRPDRSGDALAAPVLCALIGATLLISWSAACHLVPEPRDEGQAVVRTEPAFPDDRAIVLYDRHCAFCHGETGSPPDEMSRFLVPPPRDFGLGLFHLVSAANGIPTDRDLERAISRGLPGSSMPGFGWLSPAELGGLARYVRHLSVTRMTEAMLQESRDAGEELELEAAFTRAREAMTPGATLPPTASVEPTPEVLELGRWLYLEKCAACHGADGKGREAPEGWNPRADYKWARDFTAGILRGGRDAEDLDRRVRAGMPGSSMPPTRFQEPAHAAALLAYLETLIPDGADERLLQTRRDLRAVRIPSRSPLRADDPGWEGIEETEVHLSPLAWRDDAVLRAGLSLVHDGTSISIRIRWSDPSPDQRAFEGSIHGDGVAVQFSDEVEPPLFAMGSEGHPVSIWHWKAFAFRDVAGLLDLIESPPHTSDRPVADVPSYRVGLEETGRQGASLVVRGPASLGEAVRETDWVRVSSSWDDGTWTVVLNRSVHPRTREEIDLSPGKQAYLALAIWNGTAGDHGREKSITLWHRIHVVPDDGNP